jgi:hypothetical protein
MEFVKGMLPQNQEMGREPNFVNAAWIFAQRRGNEMVCDLALAHSAPRVVFF